MASIEESLASLVLTPKKISPSRSSSIPVEFTGGSAAEGGRRGLMESISCVDQAEGDSYVVDVAGVNITGEKLEGWEHFLHDHAPWRAYQCGEDGLFGLSDDKAQLCMSLGIWNGKDPMLKERLFGLTGPQGNHGEDVKECYYYLESTPTHSYTRALYKYPQVAFPYQQLLEENTSRGLEHGEYELLDTGVFSDGYWDVYAEFAKDSPCDILCKYTFSNSATSEAEIHILPQVWFRNTWSWNDKNVTKPCIQARGQGAALCSHHDLGQYIFHVDKATTGDVPVFLFTENNTNQNKILGNSLQAGSTSYYKDAFHDYIIKGDTFSVNPELVGTKVGAYYRVRIPPKSSVFVRCRLVKEGVGLTSKPFGKEFDDIINQRKMECNQFYDKVIPGHLSVQERLVATQAYAGLCHTKQYFQYHVAEWAKGGTLQTGRKMPLNEEWKHMLNHDVISMPDKWEFPWYATWDLAFHMVPYCNIDPEFAKQQLLLFLNERYLHPNGQLPAYEFNFSDVNPPVHAWACLKVYQTAKLIQGHTDVSFLKKAFNKLLLNFNWWVNKKDRKGCHIYHGGFLGMDNISCVHRSELPEGTFLEQVDGTSWMAFYSVCMLQIALELASHDDVYEDMAIKFLEHFILIVDAVNDAQSGLWDSHDGFYYDRLTTRDKAGVEEGHTLRIRSLVGLSSLFAARVLWVKTDGKLPGFNQRLQELLADRKSNAIGVHQEDGGPCLLSVPSKQQLQCMLKYMTDSEEFLSPYGIRSLSKTHGDHPVVMEVDDTVHSVSYCPGESNSDMFGGNSNWRGPVWICMNYLILEALDTYSEFYGDKLTVEYPQGSGHQLTLRDIARDIRRRLITIFLPDNSGKRPVHGADTIYAKDIKWKNLVLFYEYFHGDTGRGCGASHQTGWTALVTCILNQLAADTG